LRVRRLRLDIEVPHEREAIGAAVQSALQNQVLPKALAVAEGLLAARLGAEVRVFVRHLTASWMMTEGEESSLATAWAQDLADSVLALVARNPGPIPPAGLVSEDIAVFSSESQWHAVYLARTALDQTVPTWCFRTLLAHPDPWAQVSEGKPEEVNHLVACWERMGVGEALRPALVKAVAVHPRLRALLPPRLWRPSVDALRDQVALATNPPVTRAAPPMDEAPEMAAAMDPAMMLTSQTREAVPPDEFAVPARTLAPPPPAVPILADEAAHPETAADAEIASKTDLVDQRHLPATEATSAALPPAVQTAATPTAAVPRAAVPAIPVETTRERPDSVMAAQTSDAHPPWPSQPSDVPWPEPPPHPADNLAHRVSSAHAGLFYFVRLILELDLAEHLYCAGVREGDFLAHVARALILPSVDDPAPCLLGTGRPGPWPVLSAVAQWAIEEVQAKTLASLVAALSRNPGVAPPPAELTRALDDWAAAQPLPTEVDTASARLIVWLAATLVHLAAAHLEQAPSEHLLHSLVTLAGVVTLPQLADEPLQVHLPMSAIDLNVRRAGLDQNPGFVPWLARKLEIVFEDEAGVRALQHLP
jgi:hypothetical protein